MIIERIIAVLALAYLLWRAYQALCDYRAGRVMMRRWWIIPHWQRRDEAYFNAYTLSRDDAAAGVWLWTVFQAACIILSVMIFVLILAAP